MEAYIRDACTPAIEAAAAAAWGFPATALSLIRAYENFVYAVAGADAVIRITHTSHRQHAEIAAELDFLDYLAGRGCAVCRPRLSRQGRLVEAVGTDFHAACFARAPGEPAGWRVPSSWHARMFRNWGRAIAAMHAATVGYRPPPGRPRRHRWDGDAVTSGDWLEPCDSDITARLRASVAGVPVPEAAEDAFGLIHADVHSGNFFATPAGAVCVFDFDDASYHWFSYDLAVVAYYLPSGTRAEPPRPRTQEIWSAILEGYAGVRALPPRLAEDLARFLLLRDLQIYQLRFKKTVPALRTDLWRAEIAPMASRIRAGEPVIAVCV